MSNHILKKKVIEKPKQEQKKPKQKISPKPQMQDILKKDYKISITSRNGSIYEGRFKYIIKGKYFLKDTEIKGKNFVVNVPWVLVDMAVVAHIHPVIDATKIKAISQVEEVVQSKPLINNREKIFQIMFKMRSNEALWTDIANYLNEQRIPTLSGRTTKWTGPNARLAFLSLEKELKKRGFLNNVSLS